MIAERRGIETHLRRHLQLAAGLADRCGKRGAHAVIPGIEDQHGALVGARRFPLGDQRRQTGEAAAGLVVVERKRRVVRSGAWPDEVRV